jgi:hypothetical protein
LPMPDGPKTNNSRSRRNTSTISATVRSRPWKSRASACSNGSRPRYGLRVGTNTARSFGHVGFVLAAAVSAGVNAVVLVNKHTRRFLPVTAGSCSPSSARHLSASPATLEPLVVVITPLGVDRRLRGRRPGSGTDGTVVTSEVTPSLVRSKCDFIMSVLRSPGRFGRREVRGRPLSTSTHTEEVLVHVETPSVCIRA